VAAIHEALNKEKGFTGKTAQSFASFSNLSK
jgi:hypothetical protein